MSFRTSPGTSTSPIFKSKMLFAKKKKNPTNKKVHKQTRMIKNQMFNHITASIIPHTLIINNAV